MDVEQTTTDTLESTPETTTAAPAIAETPQTPETSERPTSMLDALQRVAAKEEAAAALKETAATGQAAPTSQPGAHGEPPQEKWPTILDNARTKAASEATAKVESELGWARSVPRESLEQMAGIAQRMTADPIAFLEQFVAELHAHPQYAPQLRSQAARILGGRSTVPVDLGPDVQIVDANGNVTGQTFSADRVKALLQQEVARAIGSEVAPIKQTFERQRVESEAKAQAADIEARADAIIADVSAFEGFEELKPAIARALETHPTWGVERAYVEAFNTEYRPKLDQRAEQRVIQNNNKKAAGNTANGTGVAAIPARPKTREDLRRTLESLHGGQAG